MIEADMLDLSRFEREKVKFYQISLCKKVKLIVKLAQWDETW